MGNPQKRLAVVRRFALLFALLMPVCASAILGDLNEDGQVNLDDFFLLSDHFGEKGPPNPPDTVVVVRVDTLRQAIRDTVVVVRVDTLRQVIRDTVVVVRVDTLRQVIRDTVVVGQKPFNGTALLPRGAQMEFVWIEPGTFVMGSPDSDPWANIQEKPQHQVTLTQGFWLGKYELTQGQWSTVMGTVPWSGKSYVREAVDKPAVYISWDDLQAFVRTLNVAAGDSLYRLPTEAEWEYACRAGTETRWSFGDDESQLGDYAWYDQNAWNVGLTWAQTAGQKQPNPWGLYDMHGNVSEWVQDRFGYWPYPSTSQIDPGGPPSVGSTRVFRGGFFINTARSTRASFRDSYSPDYRYHDIGARLLRIK